MSRKDLDALGSQRESLSTNPLLIQVRYFVSDSEWTLNEMLHVSQPPQAEVGKVRRRCFSLPSKDFTYGMRSVCLDGGATEGT